MRFFSGLFFITFALTQPYLCQAHHARYAVDSVDAVTGQRIRVIRNKIGDVDYHKLGEVILERHGDSYQITFPIVAYSSPPEFLIDKPSDIEMPAGSLFTLQLGNDTAMEKSIQQDTKVMWHYWLHYYVTHSRKRNSGPPAADVYIYHDKIPRQYYLTNNRDLYGRCWWVNIDFTEQDMRQISKHSIHKAYVTLDGNNLYLPIKHRQATHIRKSAALLLRD
jgi:hypothetical protein